METKRDAVHSSQKLSYLLTNFYDKAEKCFTILVDDRGKNGHLDLEERMKDDYSNTPLVTYFDVEGTPQRQHLKAILKDDGDLLFVFDNDEACSITEIESLGLILAFQDICLAWGLSAYKIEQDVF